ncbi:hypothetical protein HF1_01600 [Mycoplasma haemofelis str. Langford 1]|uniref:Uncharacterized protein n=2 Tax=Mycoplasma haemofelis TaxID=29501 RepID=F6FG14_MYCHI|nr:hypothetical protein [Mycoplasma haemofelis]AEG72480.1 hypothetical protein MHF_0181 [Mycoplasma haemofelis Ohio2]CBY92168.1 hypothetical protein HF1_01600 [Mycoplasma haemofelis str. Langford 1]
MTFAAKLASVGSVAAGAVGSGGGGAYYASLETIEAKLKGKLLGSYDDFKSTWEHKYKKLQEGKDSLSETLKKIKDGKEMALHCHKNYSSTHKSIFSKGEDSELLEETKKWCTQTFKDQLSIEFKTGGKVLDVTSSNTDESEFKANYKKLKSHDEKAEGSLTEELKKLAPTADDSTSAQNWQKLQSYCKSVHDQYLTLATVEAFKVAKKYCIKAGT